MKNIKNTLWFAALIGITLDCLLLVGIYDMYRNPSWPNLLFLLTILVVGFYWAKKHVSNLYNKINSQIEARYMLMKAASEENTCDCCKGCCEQPHEGEDIQ